MNRVIWDMTQRRERTEEEKKRIKERMERFAAYGYPMREDPDYAYDPAPWGEYRIVLSVGDQEFTKYASILQDHWYDK